MVGKVSGIRNRKRKSLQKDGEGLQDGTSTTPITPTSPVITALATFNGPAAAESFPQQTPPSHQDQVTGSGTSTGSAITPRFYSYEIAGPELDMSMSLDVFEIQAASASLAQDSDFDAWPNNPDTSLPDFSNHTSGHMPHSSEDSLSQLPSLLTSPSKAACLPEALPPVTKASTTGTYAPPTAIGDQDELLLISACYDIIKSLVVLAREKSARLDVVLGACKSHITQLAAIIKGDAFEHSPGCRTTVSTVLNLVIHIFESCIHTDDANLHLGEAGGPAGLPGQQPGVGCFRRFRFRYPLPPISFGAIEFDDGEHEQFSMCRHIMHAEVTRTQALLSSLRQRRLTRSCQAAVSAAKMQETWCEDFKTRLDDLLALLGGSEKCRPSQY